MDRRQFLSATGAGALGAGALGAGMAGCTIPLARRPTTPDPGIGAPSPGPAAFIPSYRIDDALFDGVPLRNHPDVSRNLPAGYDGPAVLLTRLALDDATARTALMPVGGHGISISPDGRTGIFHCQSATHTISFDPATLDVIAATAPFADARVGGGHAKFLPDGAAFLAAERAPYGPYLGAAERHFGRIVIRDTETLREIDSFSSHGVAPHDMQVFDNGRHVLVANYGSTQPASWTSDPETARIVAPRATIIEVASGRLVDTIAGTPGETELRHLAIADDGAIAAIQVRTGAPGGSPATYAGLAARDRTLFNGDREMLSAHMLVRSGDRAREVIAADPMAMRQGLSIAYDPLGHQFMATHPSAHTVVVVDATSGDIAGVVDTRTWGLAYPCGLALHPDGQTYLVAGAFADVITFDRLTHLPVEGRSYRLDGFQHSHMVVA